MNWRKMSLFKKAKITAFGSTRRPNVVVEKDPNLKALLESGTNTVAIFGKSWDLHVETVMGIKPEENLSMIRESVAYLKNHQKEVIYDAEHFFDGYAANRDFALNTILAAAKGGADVIVLCDTNGGTLTFGIDPIIQDVRTALDKFVSQTGESRCIKIGIHAHDDCGLAVANSIAAVKGRGRQWSTAPLNGYGERCGNADLSHYHPHFVFKNGL